MSVAGDRLRSGGARCAYGTVVPSTRNGPSDESRLSGSGSDSDSGSDGSSAASEATLRAQMVSEAQAEWTAYGPLVVAVFTMVLVVVALVWTAVAKQADEPVHTTGQRAGRERVGCNGRW